MQLLGSEQEVGVSNQTLYYDDLVVGNEYFVVCRNLSGPANMSAKICFNHFDGTTCDHVYSGNTGVYSNVCVSFKAVYKANVANYVFNVNSASSAGNSISIVPWTYVTPTSSSIITRIGTLLPANFTASPITYGLTIGVTYVLQDAAGNTHYISADGTTPCTATLSPELPVALRATDRCPNIKAINNSIATDRQICGASRYEWEFTQLLPTPSTAVIVQGGLNTNVLFLNAVPGMANGKTYDVRVRSRHSSGSIGEWGPSQCLKTTGSGMILEPELESFLSLIQGNEGVSVYPNPSSQAVLNVQSMDGWMSERLNIQIWDVQGKRIFAKDVYASGAQFSLPLSSSFSDGLYWIIIKDGNTEHRLRWVLSK
jgi:hypothetical protein